MLSFARYLILGAACLALQGCWFVFIPAGLLAGEPFYCVSPTAKAGDHIKLTDGRDATVKAVYGEYAKCQDKYPGTYPLKADLTF
jgi:hypothetical protein